ncbi:MAG TPA: alpha/beta hydrolase [Thermopetrobacter sp.]|nr:alpha/beta hydrolase [Thermopetrobacter sp.]
MTSSEAPPLHATERLTPPPGLRTLWLDMGRGMRLRCALARPARGAARGTVVILPGRAEYIERYYETIERLLARRYAVAILEWRGQGLSTRLTGHPLRGHVGGFRHYDADLARFMREVVLPDCPGPLYGWAHSMGATVLLRAAWRRIWFERALLVAPMIDLKRRNRPIWWWRLVAATGTYLGLGRLFAPGQRKRLPCLEDFTANELTSDEWRYRLQQELLERHPELCVAGVSLGWLHAAFRAIDSLRAIAGRHAPPRWPMLMALAGDDTVVSGEAAADFARAVGDISHISIPCARHAIHLERDQCQVGLWAAFDSFIGQQGGPDAVMVSQDSIAASS